MAASESSEEEFDEYQAMVIDNGSSTIKAGFSGSDAPKCVFSTLVGHPCTSGETSTTTSSDCVVGYKAYTKRILLDLKYPIEQGHITNWDDMEQVWYHTFVNELRVNPEDYSVLHTQPHNAPKESRENIIEVMF